MRYSEHLKIELKIEVAGLRDPFRQGPKSGHCENGLFTHHSINKIIKNCLKTSLMIVCRSKVTFRSSKEQLRTKWILKLEIQKLSLNMTYMHGHYVRILHKFYVKVVLMVLVVRKSSKKLQKVLGSLKIRNLYTIFVYHIKIMYSKCYSNGPFASS